jgi:histidinol-phosphate/aromatic aminotransferase/cobyric acid decarboxylase-like protein
MERHALIPRLMDIYGGLLAEGQRRALTLLYDEDLSLQEMAQVLGCSRQAAHDAVRRGTQRLKALESQLRMLQVRSHALAALHALDAGDTGRARLCEQLRAMLNGLAFNRYPEIDAYSLRQELARGLGLNTEQVLAGNGSSELLYAACQAFGGPGRKIAYIYPSFSMYKTYAALSDSEGLAFPLDADFSLDAGRLSAFLRKQRPDILLICNPNNPTGTLYPAKELSALIANADCLVLLDEAYTEFAPAGSSLLDNLKEFKNLAVFRTFSKAYGLAGLRVGYMASANSEIMRAVGKALLP